jgi:hypothetical protein
MDRRSEFAKFRRGTRRGVRRGVRCGVRRGMREKLLSADPQKKLAWTDLDRVSFKKFVKQSSVEIEKSAWSDLDKSNWASSAASVFKFSSGLVTWGSPKRFALRWPDLDKGCSRCYTLRGCGFADVQSREELKMLLQAKRQPG